MRCAAKPLQVVVKDGLKGKLCSKQLAKARAVVRKLRCPSAAVVVKRRAGLVLIQDIETRWGSTHKMPESLF